MQEKKNYTSDQRVQQINLSRTDEKARDQHGCDDNDDYGRSTNYKGLLIYRDHQSFTYIATTKYTYVQKQNQLNEISIGKTIKHRACQQT